MIDFERKEHYGLSDLLRIVALRGQRTAVRGIGCRPMPPAAQSAGGSL